MKSDVFIGRKLFLPTARFIIGFPMVILPAGYQQSEATMCCVSLLCLRWALRSGVNLLQPVVFALLNSQGSGVCSPPASPGTQPVDTRLFEPTLSASEPKRWNDTEQCGPEAFLSQLDPVTSLRTEYRAVMQLQGGFLIRIPDMCKTRNLEIFLEELTEMLWGTHA